MQPHESDRESLKLALENQIRRVNTRIEYYDRWDNRVSAMRLVVFLSGLTLTILAGKFGSPWLFFVVLLGSIIAFVGLVRHHRKIYEVRDQFRLWSSIRSTHLARMSLDWDKLNEKHPVDVDEHHPFAHNLNIVGTHSLLEVMDTAIYPGGTEKLVDLLLETRPDLSNIQDRRTLVEELKPLSYFRDQLQLRAMQVQARTDPYDWDMPTLFRWLEHAKGRSYKKSLFILFSLSLINIVLLILFLTGVINAYFILSFLVYLLVYNANRGKISGLLDDASRIETLLRRLNNVLKYLETYHYKSGSGLSDFCAIYHNAESLPSQFLKKIIRLTMAASTQINEIYHTILNLTVPWDLYFSHRLNLYKGELTEKLKPWLDRFYELEALCSIANFSWLNPDYIFPVIHSDIQIPSIHARDLGHPLIKRDRKITNDVTINNPGSLLLITGSNMSGKSTFLRTLGINLCLSFAGGPVNATEFQTIPFRIFSSINVSDSLNEGLSHFYAEVKHLKAMLEELEKPDQWPLFFLIDEIFRGTNNRERLIGSEALLKNIAGKNGVGVVSTHDLELVQLEEEITQLSNWHFEETIENGRMSFNYKLKKGPCPTTNALKIMEMEGLPVKS